MEFEVSEMVLHPVKLSHLTARLIAPSWTMPCEYQIPKLVLLQYRLYTAKRSSSLPLFGQIEPQTWYRLSLCCYVGFKYFSKTSMLIKAAFIWSKYSKKTCNKLTVVKNIEYIQHIDILTKNPNKKKVLSHNLHANCSVAFWLRMVPRVLEAVHW